MSDTKSSVSQPGPAADLIDHAAGIIAAKKREPHTAPYHWAGALWEAGMLHAPGSLPMQPDPTSPLDIDAIKKRADEATPGPWHVGAGWVYTEPVYADDNRLSNVLGTKYAEHDRVAAETARVARNVEFIAYARRDVPALLAALAEAQRDLAATKKDRDLADECRREADRDGMRLAEELTAARAEAERTRRELTDAGWSSVADLHAAYVDVLARWQRSGPVVEAVRVWRAAELPPDAHNKVFSALNALAVAFDAFEHPEDTYETREGTDG